MRQGVLIALFLAGMTTAAAAQEVTNDQLKKMSPQLASEIQAAIEKAGLKGYQVNTVSMTKRPDATTAGLIPSCHMECTVGGFPPKVDCHLVCD